MVDVRALLAADSGLELQFVRHRESGTVHVIVLDDPDEVAEEFRFSEIPEDVALSFACGDTATLCGYLARINVGETGDVKVSEFDDVDLCRRCHRVLGPEHQHRAFEHAQPEREPDAGNVNQPGWS
jgi:hypothetical protein